VHFTKLRVTGFKSFVEPTEVVIEPGMTGVVGPNGCGKSNVVEALRWVMGETSAKQMRGGEMDDVIFGGTANRPARNIAEVALHLDNADRTAPAQYNDSTEIEVSRRIERGAGSTYRINGREVRARDVQLLFADLATGAHSTAMVSQGRIGALIGAKPTERRTLLEEAAGITGLHSRRHEAELRLRAAETNLERLDDVIGALEGQYQGLQRQARQATRYRKMSEELRQLEAVLLHARWTAATQARDEARERLHRSEQAVTERTAAAGAGSTRQSEAAAAMPGLRDAEAKAAAELQRLVMARRELESEESRVQEGIAETDRQMTLIAADIERERTLAADAGRAVEALETEQAAIAAASDGEETALTDARKALEAVRGELRSLEQSLEALTEQVAKAEARASALDRQKSELQQRIARLDSRAREIGAERDRLSEAISQDSGLADAEREVATAEQSVAHVRRHLTIAEEARAEVLRTEAAARQAAQQADAALARLAAEEKTLAGMLESGETDLFPPLIDALRVDAGYEAALGAALGEELAAPTDTAAEIHWANLPPIGTPPALPGGAAPLSRFVHGPDALARCLPFIGVLDDASVAAALAPSLQPGQMLVSRDGGLWRWDGYTVQAGAPTPAAKRLQQRNRLAELRTERAAAEAESERTGQRLQEVEAAVQSVTAAEKRARQTQDEAYARLNAARTAHAQAASTVAGTQSRVSTLSESAEQLLSDLRESEQAMAETEAAIASLEDPSEARRRIETLRAQVTEQRTVEAERRSAHDRTAREVEERKRRLAAIAQELGEWRSRVGNTAARLDHLAERRQSSEQQKTRLSARPAEIEQQRSALLDTIARSEQARQAAADRLAEGEAALADADKALRAAESALAEARETRVRAEAQLEQAETECRTVAERIRERLRCAPDDVLSVAQVAAGETPPDIAEVEEKIERLGRQRDAMGPVNLRAETELAELEEQITTMKSEREDLIAAIARLRQGIASLNREGRERLLAAFETVNQHFQELFVRLFGGGRAHLALTEAEDPLDAGLEIMASPPGKKLQIMSLLSGGEQALTALSLLFAVFLTNPAPICVLDEVDAPLDDANVDRFCTLLDEIAHSGQTRFLCVTHHRMTMARMDRLFGVTMGERGVSQLVSVDLRRAEALRESA
jgi:chromosome segregation protein